MGSINTIWQPEYWKIRFVGKSKIIKGDIIYKMVVGEWDDYYCCEILEYISEDNYENIIKGNYSIKRFPYSSVPILLFNEQQELIPLVKGYDSYYDKLSEDQKEYIADINNKKILRKTIK